MRLDTMKQHASTSGGGTQSVPFPTDTVDVLGEREPEGWDEVRPLLSRKRALSGHVR